MEKWEFNRHVTDDLIRSLKEQPLWQEKLKGDCEAGNVFLAIRKDRVGFYHKGSSLFEFGSQSFSTNAKYASVIDTDKTYVTQEQLKEMRMISDFFAGYKRIKENCALYSGAEAKGVSYLYQESHYLKQASISVLDIEIVLRDGSNAKDRIDVLLYDSDSQTLRFVEAKHFTNSDLWSTSTPRAVEQIKNYEEQISLHAEKLKEEYGCYIDNLNKIFELNKPMDLPRNVDPKVSLLIFGFDSDQKQGDRFNKLVLNNPEYGGIPIYSKGGSDGLRAETIWKEVTEITP